MDSMRLPRLCLVTGASVCGRDQLAAHTVCVCGVRTLCAIRPRCALVPVSQAADRQVRFGRPGCGWVWVLASAEAATWPPIACMMGTGVVCVVAGVVLHGVHAVSHVKEVAG
jgi:hypothetical protein